jgi:hypothetical protein
MAESRVTAEGKLRAIAVPAALALAVAFHAWPTGHWLQRTFLSMIVHELGHAVTAWWCGFAAIPGLWKTLIPEARGVVAPLLVTGSLGFVLWRGVVARHRVAIGVVAVLLALQAAGTLGVATEHAHAIAIFGGDAGAMVLGTILVVTFFAPADSRLVTNQLRWGTLVIGAAAYVDAFATWWSARGNPDVIPYGEIEGVGLSDPSKLVEDFGWTQAAMISRFCAVGVSCALVLLVAWLLALRASRAPSS